MIRYLATAFAGLVLALPLRADTPFVKVADEVNAKMVKLFGSGGFKGIVSYGTGIIVSPEGHILTLHTPTLDTRDLRVHLYDGRRYHCKVLVLEPVLDIALVKIDTKEKLEPLPYYDITAAAKEPMLKTGSGVLAFSNQFEIATRDEPLSVMRGIVSAVTKLKGRRGIHEYHFDGQVYIVDAITNNPGAAGGALTTRDGRLIGLLGKELKNELTDTWVNYAIPINASVEITDRDNMKTTTSIVEVVEKKEKYVTRSRDPSKNKEENYTGLILVPNVVEQTPPYVEDVLPGSPAAKAGLKPDDLIVYVDGEQAQNITELNRIFSRIRPESPVKLEIRRGDRLQTVTFIMGKPLRRAPEKQPEKPADKQPDK